MYILQSIPQRITDTNGDIVSGAIAYFYITGTTTPKTVYADQAGATPLGTSVTADSGGKFVQIWLNNDTEYRVEIKTPGGVTLFGPLDNISGMGAGEVSTRSDLASTADNAKGDALVGLKRTQANSVATTVHAWVERQAVSPLDFGAVGDGGTDDTTAMTRFAAYTGPKDLLTGYVWRITADVTMSGKVFGRGYYTNQSRIKCDGGALVVGDEGTIFEDFALEHTATNTIAIKNAFAKAKFRGLRILGSGSGVGQKGIEYDTTSRSIYFTEQDVEFHGVSYPVWVKGVVGQSFNSNELNRRRGKWYDFVSAITFDGPGPIGANFIGGYFESGTNVISLVSGTFSGNIIDSHLDSVTRHLNNTPAITSKNYWLISGASDLLHTGAGGRPTSDDLYGVERTRVRATQATAQSINSATPTAMQFDTEVYDTLSEFTPGTGLFTAKEAGKYNVKGSAISASAAWDVGERWELIVYKNGAAYATGASSMADAATTRQRTATVNVDVSLAAGDTITVRVQHNQGAAVALDTAPTINFIEINRL